MTAFVAAEVLAERAVVHQDTPVLDYMIQACPSKHIKGFGAQRLTAVVPSSILITRMHLLPNVADT